MVSVGSPASSIARLVFFVLVSSSVRNKRKPVDNDVEGPVPDQVNRRATNVLEKLLPCNIPNSAFAIHGGVGCIDYTQLHPCDFSVANQPEIEQTSVLHMADLAESQGGTQIDILADSEAVNLAVKRYFEPDDQPVLTKKAKKPTTDHNRQFIPKLSPGLQAKFNRLPSAGGVLLIDTGKVTPWSTHPSTSYGGSSSSTAIQPLSLSEVVPVKQDATMDEDG